MNPHVITSLSPVKDCLIHSETMVGVCAPVSECHPSSRPVTARDLVPAVDHLATGEALKLKLAFTAFVASHSPLSSASSLKSLFTGSGRRSEHVLVVVFVVF